MINFFIVVEPDMEYNDETYSQNGFTETIKIYATKELAEAQCKWLNLNMVHEHDSLGSYGYSLSDLTSHSVNTVAKKLKALEMSFNGNADDFDQINVKLVNMDNLEVFLAIFDRLPVSYVSEIPLEGTAHDIASAFAKQKEG